MRNLQSFRTVSITTIKTELECSIGNPIYELCTKLSKNLRGRNLGNKEAFRNLKTKWGHSPVSPADIAFRTDAQNYVMTGTKAF